jgi:hypothetical protein
MQVEASYLSAFLVALLGGVHCFGMCGGIVGALNLGLAPQVRTRFIATMPYVLAYNAGRIISYSIAGALAGGVGAWAMTLVAMHHGQRMLQVVAGMFMVMLGLYLAGWWHGLVHVERMGGGLWKRLEPLRRRLLPVRTPAQALGMGLVWGWLPCGLVYSVLIWSISAGSAREGALLMLSFGLGTLPALLAMGAFAATLAGFVTRPWVRRCAGSLVMLLGAYQVWAAFAGFI